MSLSQTQINEFMRILMNSMRSMDEMNRATRSYADSVREAADVVDDMYEPNIWRRRLKRDKQNQLKAQQYTDRVAKSYTKLNAATKKVAKEIRDNGAATAESIKEYSEAIEQIKETTGKVEDSFESFGKKLESGSRDVVNDLDAMNKATRNRAKQSIDEARKIKHIGLPDMLEKMTDQIEYSIVNFSRLSNILRLVGNFFEAAQKNQEMVTKSIETGTDAITTLPGPLAKIFGYSDSLNDVAKDLRMSHPAIQADMKSRRQLINAMALEQNAHVDLTDQTKTYREAMKIATTGFTDLEGKAVPSLTEAFYRLTGDYEKGHKMMMDVMQLQRQFGMKLSGKEMQQVAKETGILIETMRNMGDLTSEEIGSMVKDYLNSSDSQMQMMRARTDQEKAATQLSLLNQMKEQIALGKLTKNSLEAAEAIKAFKGLSPKERMKQTAYARAMAGAYGLKGMDKFLQAMNTRQDLRTPEMNEAIRTMSDQVTNLKNTMSAQGGSGEMIFAEMSSKIPELMKVFEKAETITTKGNAVGLDQMKTIEESVRKQTDNSDKLVSGWDNISESMKKWFDQYITPITSDPKFDMLLAGVAAIAAGLLALRHLSGMLTTLQNTKKVLEEIKNIVPHKKEAEETATETQKHQERVEEHKNKKDDDCCCCCCCDDEEGSGKTKKKNKKGKKKTKKKKGKMAGLADSVSNLVGEEGALGGQMSNLKSSGMDAVKNFIGDKIGMSDLPIEEMFEKLGGWKRLGSIGKKLPLAGAAIGGGIFLNKLMDGDMTGAAGEVGSTLIGQIPIAGPALALGFDEWFGSTFGKNDEGKTDVTENVNKMAENLTNKAQNINEKIGEPLTEMSEDNKKMLEVLSKQLDSSDKTNKSLTEQMEMWKTLFGDQIKANQEAARKAATSMYMRQTPVPSAQ